LPQKQEIGGGGAIDQRAVICENEPVTGFVTWMVAVPSCAAEGSATCIWLACAESRVPVLPATLTCRLTESDAAERGHSAG